MKPLQELVRPAIWKLKPYSSARDEYHGTASVFIDANENPWNAPYNRYPDPLQQQLKEQLSLVKQVSPEQIFLGNGSDEAIDLVIRIFCDPTVDEVVAIDPSYGMYEVAAGVNDVGCRKVLLDDHFDLDVEAVLGAADVWTKVIFLCSPNNPTGNLLSRERILQVLDRFEGIVVVDEAYIDFADAPSFLTELEAHPNLIVLQTFSKAWGAAGLRVGMAFAAPEIIALFNKVKYPYNLSEPVQREALRLLDNGEQREWQRKKIVAERRRLQRLLSAPPYAFRVYPSDANFLLVEVGQADRVYRELLKQGVVVRNRNMVSLCHGCLRITVGTDTENELLLKALKKIVKSL